jgi:phosphodiesterase/alkaline phosphatase D-like protein
MKLLKIAAVLLICACFAAAQTPGTTQPTSTTPQAGTQQVEKAMLEFANANQAKVAWTSKQSADLGVHYGTDPKNLTQAADAIEKAGGDNHRATLTSLQPNTTYYVQMTTNTGQPVGPVYTFKTPAQGQAPIHQQTLTPQ